MFARGRGGQVVPVFFFFGQSLKNTGLGCTYCNSLILPTNCTLRVCINILQTMVLTFTTTSLAPSTMCTNATLAGTMTIVQSHLSATQQTNNLRLWDQIALSRLSLLVLSQTIHGGIMRHVLIKSEAPYSEPEHINSAISHRRGGGA